MWGTQYAHNKHFLSTVHQLNLFNSPKRLQQMRRRHLTRCGRRRSTSGENMFSIFLLKTESSWFDFSKCKLWRAFKCVCQDGRYMLKADPLHMKEVIQKKAAPWSNQVRKGPAWGSHLIGKRETTPTITEHHPHSLDRPYLAASSSHQNQTKTKTTIWPFLTAINHSSASNN